MVAKFNSKTHMEISFSFFEPFCPCVTTKFEKVQYAEKVISEKLTENDFFNCVQKFSALESHFTSIFEALFSQKKSTSLYPFLYIIHKKRKDLDLFCCAKN
jgi:hypothetical protein